MPPGTYTITLRVGGQRFAQPLSVRNDPRSPASTADVQTQYRLQTTLVRGMRASWDAAQQAIAARASLGAATTPVAAEIDSLIGSVGDGRGGATVRSVNAAFLSQLMTQENADQSPTPAMQAAVTATCRELDRVLTHWSRLTTVTLPALNAQRAQSAGARIPLPAGSIDQRGCGR